MNLMHLQMGVSALGGLANYGIASIESAMQESRRKFNNTMAKLNAAEAHNTITLNQALADDANLNAAMQQEITHMQDSGVAEVNAAVNGARGQVVAGVLQDLRMSNNRAEGARMRQYRVQRYASEVQRYNTDLSAISGQNYMPVSRPSLGTALLGIGSDMAGIYENYQPESRKITTRGATSTGSTVLGLGG